MAEDRSASYGTRDPEKEVGMAWPHLEKISIQYHKTVSDMEPAREKKKGTATEHLDAEVKLTGMGWGQLVMVAQNRQCWRAVSDGGS